ncbi:ATP-grasp domain-containing protein [Alteromonas facilis]|uniref:ATP-grasp domain-containing protein n=1 Tax=Alteromonas facilis TaxID=2048004 RepID=UPI000C28BCC1|nr:hypothetical protein [Alteromonas facilis]
MRTPYTLLVGSAEDAHVSHMQTQLLKRRRHTLALDTQCFPKDIQISYDPNRGEGSLCINDETIWFEQICSIFWRSFTPLCSNSSIAERDTLSMLKTFFSESSLNWVNPYSAIVAHQAKPRQLQIARSLGALLPKTYVGNCPQAALAFLNKTPKAIFKPVHGGALTEIVQPGQRTIEYLQHVLKLSPVTLQAFIPGTNIRTYVIGSETFSIEFASDAIDFREDQYAQAHAVAIPEPIKLLAKAITYYFGMQWSAVDWRCDHEGRYYFLEVNPSPMFIAVEQATGIPLTDALTELLLEPYNECEMPTTE